MIPTGMNPSPYRRRSFSSGRKTTSIVAAACLLSFAGATIAIGPAATRGSAPQGQSGQWGGVAGEEPCAVPFIDPCFGEGPGMDDEEWFQWEKLLRNDPLGAVAGNELDSFGIAVAADGDVMIVGASRRALPIDPDDKKSPVNPNAGAAYVFRFIEGSWYRVAELQPPTPCIMTGMLRFGSSVAIAASTHSDVAVVGAPLENHTGFANAGKAYVFRRVGEVFHPRDNPIEEEWVREGMSATVEVDEKEQNPFLLCGAEPHLRGHLPFEGEDFGFDVAILPFQELEDGTCTGGDLIVVGAPFSFGFEPVCPTPIFQTGAAYVFRHQAVFDEKDEFLGTFWEPEGFLSGDCLPLENFGRSVSATLSHDDGSERIGVGAWLGYAETTFKDPKTGEPQPGLAPLSGSAFVFVGVPVKDVGTVWVSEAKLAAGNPQPFDLFGVSVSMTSWPLFGDVFVVGGSLVSSFLYDDDFEKDDKLKTIQEGAAFVYRRLPGSGWALEQMVTAFEPQTQSGFGTSVSVDGNVLVVGADQENHPEGVFNEGAAYVYRFDAFDGGWSDVDRLTAYGPFGGMPGDRFGFSVGISGNAIVAGAYAEDEGGIVGSGAAYTYGRCSACPGSGSCFLANGTPGCVSAGLCNLVCFLMPTCCEDEWTQECADLAASLPGVGAPPDCPGFGSCCFANGTPGCGDVGCCAAVCELMPECCDNTWSGACAALAIDICGESVCPPVFCLGNCGETNVPGDCSCDADCFANGDCCPDVCTFCDEFADCGAITDSCESHCGGETPSGCWCDPLCVDFADCCDDFCDHCSFYEVCTPALSADLTGDGQVNTFDLLIMLNAFGPCPSPINCPADLNGDGVVNVFDLLILLSEWTGF